MQHYALHYIFYTNMELQNGNIQPPEILVRLKKKKILFYIDMKLFRFLVFAGWVLWHINHCRLFNAKSSLYIYIKYI